jgi:hypothetical protein
MGAWGPGLYSDDFALDLRTAIGAVSRLPMDGPEIVTLLAELEPAAHAVTDPDHPTFWLVVADQLHRRGIASPARERALQIIDEGTDVRRLRELGMSEPDLEKRSRMLDKLRRTIAAPLPTRARKTLKKPQPLLMDRGQVYAYPVNSRGNCINPYFRDKVQAQFTPAGWAAFLVVNCGHALGYLAWYQLASRSAVTREQPDLSSAIASIDLDRIGIGTMSKSHAAKMEIELLGDADPVPSIPPPGTRAAVSTTASDISLSNLLSRWATPGSFP